MHCAIVRMHLMTSSGMSRWSVCVKLECNSWVCMYINVRVSADEQSVDACGLADLISILLKTPSDMHLPAIWRGIKQGNGAENLPPLSLAPFYCLKERIMWLNSRLGHTNQTWGKTVCIVANTSVIQGALFLESAKCAVLFESAFCFIRTSFRISLSLHCPLLQPLSSWVWVEGLDLWWKEAGLWYFCQVHTPMHIHEMAYSVELTGIHLILLNWQLHSFPGMKLVWRSFQGSVRIELFWITIEKYNFFRC